METLLYYLHYGLLLLFGLVLSAAFSGVRLSKRSCAVFGALFLLCGMGQLGLFLVFHEDLVWKLYPLIVHLPTVLVLTLVFRKRISTTLAAVASAYLCCQPARWFGILVLALTGNPLLDLIVRVLVLVLTAVICLIFLSPSVSHIYNRNGRWVWIFGIIPLVYYAFDYAAGIYSDLWAQHRAVAAEFLPFFLCLGHMLFCLLYHREFIQTADAERKEQLIRVTAEQQAKEIEAIRRGDYELRLLRHDLRLLLNSLSMCIEEGDKETARTLIAGLTDKVDASSVKRWCGNDALNYLLSDYAAQCREQGTEFSAQVELTGELPDPVILCTILANGLDNALNAQKALPDGKRSIKLMLKTSGGKTLLSIKNPYLRKPSFVDGSPVSHRPGHGYGTQSIRYAAEQLGGKAQFTLEEDRFVLRVMI